MTHVNRPNSNVIQLTPKRQQRINGPVSKGPSDRETRIIAITSGKGGVGKTNIVANLGISMVKLGKKVMILDADMGLGNLDILLGISPKYNLSHVALGEKRFSDIIVEGPGNIRILPAASGIQELSQLSKAQTAHLLSELYRVLDPVDILLIDTAAGISSNVLHFNAISQEIIIVTSPEPTAITDAYAIMKILSLQYGAKSFRLLVNMVNDIQEAHEVYRQLSLVAERFLDIHIEYLGHVFFDRNVVRGVKLQQVVTISNPTTMASRCYESLAAKILETSELSFPLRDAKGFLKHLISNKMDFSQS
ncbi:MinD/ParA family protein [Desulfatirhabdium butyrativorans]|uniref:MinD/ParA family protein n=1 Tax=Desulfatirhabdium butyrativorans TaxID=340467 RepID=UPI000405549E|nr:MinD/ParA family protein [Desulfatirhabdium butyrativorans]